MTIKFDVFTSPSELPEWFVEDMEHNAWVVATDSAVDAAADFAQAHGDGLSVTFDGAATYHERLAIWFAVHDEDKELVDHYRVMLLRDFNEASKVDSMANTTDEGGLIA